MIKSFISVAFRNLVKQKFYSLLNISGLAIGISCFLLISLFILDELSYDQHFKDASRVYRINFHAVLNGADHSSANTGAPVAQALRTDFPEVEDATRLNTSGNWFVRQEDQIESFKEENVLMADSNFFSFFGIKPVYGDPHKALNRPNTLALDHTTSKKIFGDINPVGKVLVLDNRTNYEVTAVYPDMPSNTHFQHNMLLSMSSFSWTNNNNWLSTNFNTYLKLKGGIAPESLEAKFPKMIETYCSPLLQQFLGMTIDEFRQNGNALDFSLIPLLKIHLYSHNSDELAANGDIKYVAIFVAVGLFILILAIINFMNLATARSAGRAKEVGIRKVVGAYRKQLILQFLAEAITITTISFLVALLLTIVVLPYFNDLTSKTLVINDLLSPSYIIIGIATLLVVGLVSGSYPALFLSAFKPVQVLKGKLHVGKKNIYVRSSLVIFQFTISIIMMISTAVIYDQLSYIQNKKLGYNKDQILVVKDTWLLRDKAQIFKNELLQNANILNGTMTNFNPTSSYGNSDLHFKSPDAAEDMSQVIVQAWVDFDFLPLMEMEFVDGRAFNLDFATDSTAAILNEAAVRAFGYENPVGDKIYNYGDGEEVIGYPIIGVVKDFHFNSMHESIKPLIFRIGKNNISQAYLKVNPVDLDNTLSFVEKTWNDFAPGQPFSYSFLDEDFGKMYKAEQKVGSIFSVFAGLAIFIACLGLFGLASFTAEQRRKEIGIRKVLGASINHLVGQLSLNFIKLVAIAFIISIPIAAYMMNTWLEDFAYRTALSPIVFIVAGIVAMLIAWLTMGYHSYKTAATNPVNSLKEE
jgi:putative ABC transport system permease protein